MNTRSFRHMLAAAALLGSTFAATADVVYTFDSTEVGAYGSSPYGTVTLIDTGANINVKVDLRFDLNFVNTGSKSVFSFNLANAAGGTNDIQNILFNGFAPEPNTFTVVSPGVNPPFSVGTTFSFMIDCTGSACKNGAPGQSVDPLTFTVLNAEFADFGAETGSPPGTSASFAADVICVTGACNGATGAIGVTGPGVVDPPNPPALIPEPSGLALVALALLAVGAATRRRHSA